MESLELADHNRNVISLRIVVLNMMNGYIKLVDQPKLKAFNFSQLGIQTRAGAHYIFEIAFPSDSRKVLIEHPSKTNEMLHQLAPGRTLMWVFDPISKILFQLNQPLLNSRLAMIETHLYATELPNISIHRQVPQTSKGLRTLKNTEIEITVRMSIPVVSQSRDERVKHFSKIVSSHFVFQRTLNQSHATAP
jgi:hypothetical protein